MRHSRHGIYGLLLLLSALTLSILCGGTTAQAVGTFNYYPQQFEMVAKTGAQELIIENYSDHVNCWSNDTDVVQVSRDGAGQSHPIRYYVKPVGVGATTIEIKNIDYYGQVVNSGSVAVKVTSHGTFMALEKTSLELDIRRDGQTSVKITGTMSDELSAEVENPAICSAYCGEMPGWGKFLYVTPLSEGETIVTAKAAETSAYDACSATLKVKVVGKPASTVVLSDSECSMRLGDAAAKISITGTGDGRLSASSSNSNVIEASVDEYRNPPIVGLSARGSGTAVVTVTRAETTNYKSASAQIMVTVLPQEPSVPVYRLYNPYTGEHHYTTSRSERDALDGGGWNYENVAWNAPKSSRVPVYRLYNPSNGDHHYTMSRGEYDTLGRKGWKQEGTAWYSFEGKAQRAVYRLFNPYEKGAGSHHYTTDYSEYQRLDRAGWNAEGICFYGMNILADRGPGSTMPTPSAPNSVDASNGKSVSLTGTVTREEWTTDKTQMAWSAVFYFLTLDEPVNLTYNRDGYGVVTEKVSKIQVGSVERYIASYDGDVNANMDQMFDSKLQPMVGKRYTFTGPIGRMANAHFVAPAFVGELA